MIFQEPMNSLSPVYTIGDLIIEAILLHKGVTPAATRLEQAQPRELARAPVRAIHDRPASSVGKRQIYRLDVSAIVRGG